MESDALLQKVPIVSDQRTNHVPVTAITSDSRKATPGCMLICLRGTHADGHQYIAEAVEKGASLVVAETNEGIPAGVDYVLTPDTRLAEAIIWNNHYGDPASGMLKIGITGTVGKTTTAYILRVLLAAGGHTVGMSTTVSVMAGEQTLTIPDGGSSLTDGAGAMTTPDPAYFYRALAEMRDSGCDTLVYEASSHSLVQQKTAPIQPDIAIFTNLTPEHMDFHGSMENYLDAKATLFRQAKLGICPAYDDWSKRLREMVPDCPFLTCAVGGTKGEAVSADISVLRIRQGVSNTSFLYCGKDAICRMQIPFSGVGNLWNSTMAISAALQLGVHPLTVRKALAQATLPPGRMERLVLGEGIPFSVYIDYAHTPAALEQVLTTARTWGKGKLTVVFGCGGDRDRTKRPIMGEIARRLADKVVLTSDNTRQEDAESILADILRGISNRDTVTVCPDRREAIYQTIREAERGENILLCGKGHETWEIVGKTKIPFDERNIVREAVKAITDAR